MALQSPLGCPCRNGRYRASPSGRRGYASAGFTIVELLVVLTILLMLAGLLLPAVTRVREGARRVQCINNMFQLGVALHNYHDAHRTFPPGYVSAVGPIGEDLGPGWGWGAMILPMLDQSVDYNRIRFDEPMYSKENSRVANTKYDMLSCPSDMMLSNYVGCYGRGDFMIAPDSGDGLFYRNSRVRERDVEDGAMTILLGERSSSMGSATWAGVYDPGTIGLPAPVAGTPADRAYVLGHTGPAHALDPLHPPNQPSACAAGFGSNHTGGANFLMLDGSVRFITNHVQPDVFMALATRAGDEPISGTDF